MRGVVVQLTSKMKEQQGHRTEQQSAEDPGRAQEAVHGEDVAEEAYVLECKHLSDQVGAMELELQRLRARNVQHEKELDRVHLEVDLAAAEKAKTSEKLEFALKAREQAEDLLRKRQRDDDDSAGKYERRLRCLEEERKVSSEELRLAKQTLSDVRAQHNREISEKQALIDSLRHAQKQAEEQIKALEESHEEARRKIRFLAGELKEKHTQAIAEKKQAVEKATAALERARVEHKAELASLAQDLLAAVAEKDQAGEQMRLLQEREAAQDVRIEELVALLELAQKRICALQRRLEESSEVVTRECEDHKRAAQEAKTARQQAEQQLGQLQLTAQSERSAHEELVKTLEKSLEDARTEARGRATQLSEVNLRYAQEMAKTQARADQAIAARESAEAVFEKQRYELMANASRSESEVCDLKRRLKEMRNEVIAAEGKLREQLSKAISTETAFDSVRRQLAAKSSEIRQIKERLSKAEKSNSAEAENLRSALLASCDEVKRLKEESDKQRSLVGEFEQALERRESEFSARMRRMEKQLLKKEKELIAVIRAMNKKQADLDHAYNEVAGLEEIKENMSIRLLSYEEDASQTVQSLEAEIDCLSSERKRLRDELHGCRLTLESTEEALAKMKRNTSLYR